MTITARQFSSTHIEDLGEDSGEDYRYFFMCSMIGACKPLFNNCESNYEVEQRLIAAKVITSACEPDSETCALVVSFKRKDTAEQFIKRLNKYLSDKARKLNEARAF